MEEKLIKKCDFLYETFDAIPALLFVVDSDMRIQHLNALASNKFGLDIRNIYDKKSGEPLHCVNSYLVPEGCGRAEPCKLCVIRNSVNKAIQGGKVHRQRTKMNLKTGQDTKGIHLLVTTSPFQYKDKNYVLLILEDISEIIQLKDLLPICANCKKIRDEKNYWESVDTYFSTNLNIDFSHSICPECKEKFYSNIYKK